MLLLKDMEGAEITIRFSGTPEQAARLIQHTEVWGAVFGASSGISVEFNGQNLDGNRDPYVGVNEIIEFAKAGEYTTGLGLKSVNAIRRHSYSGQFRQLEDGTPARIYRDDVPYIHESLLETAASNPDLLSNFGKKSAKLIGDFLISRNFTQPEVE